jgi:outer membrane protein assembly factor BamB
MPGSKQDTDSIAIGNGPFNSNDILVCATHGKIYAIHKRTGARLWRADFPTGGQGGVVSLFITDDGKVIAGARGRTACLELMTGKPIWLNKMPVSKSSTTIHIGN